MRLTPVLVAALAVAASAGRSAAQEPVSEHGHFAEVNGARIYYEDRGEGEPLFLLHAFFRTASIWKGYADAWASQYRVIAWDSRGHGRSTNPDASAEYSYAQTARDLLALMDHLEIRRTRAMGASAGAMTLLHAATMAPERLDAIVLIGAPLYYSEEFRQAIEAQGPRDQIPELLERYVKAHGRERALQLTRQAWNFRTQYGDHAFTPDLLATISARTLIIHGDDDAYVPISHPLEMFRSIPRARLWVVPNGGHHPYGDPANYDDLLRRVGEFLEGEWDER